MFSKVILLVIKVVQLITVIVIIRCIVYCKMPGTYRQRGTGSLRG